MYKRSTKGIAIMANNIDYKRSKTDIPSSSPSKSNDTTTLRTNKISKHKRIKKLLLHRSKSEQLSDDISTLPSPTTTSFTTTLNQQQHISKSKLDNGTPSSSTYNDLQRVLKLIQDERHLVAYDLYVDAKLRIDNDRRTRANTNQQQKKNEKKVRWKQANDTAEEEISIDFEQAYKFLEDRREEFEALKNRATLFTSAKENLSINDDWIHSQTLFGISTSYRRERDNSLSIKIEGLLEGVPLFEQLVVLREVDLYNKWAPFMSKSSKLAQLDKLDVVAWFIVGIPMLGLTRDACYRAIGCDCMNEDGSIIIVAVGLNDTEEYGVKKDIPCTSQTEQPAQPSPPLPQQSMDSNLLDTTNSTFLARDEILETLEIPPIPSGMGSGRMTIRNFSASIEIVSPTSSRSKIVVNIDPNLELIPQFTIDFVMKRMCGILLTRLQTTAKKVIKDPVSNDHSRRMREDTKFYRDFLLPRFRLYCEEVGWEMPAVAAFEIESDELERDGMSWINDSVITSQQFNGSYSSSTVQSHGGTISSSVSNTSKGSKIKKIKRIFSRSESQEDKIASARAKAAQRLKPKPFSASTTNRLNELKAAKLRAEERFNSSSDSISVSSFSTYESFIEIDTKDDIKASVLTLVVSLTMYYLLQSDQSKRLADLFMMILQSICLWSLLTCILIYTFEKVDFGHLRLVSIMSGKQLLAKEIKRYALITSISVAMLSCGIGGAVSSFHDRFCSPSDDTRLLILGWQRITSSIWNQSGGICTVATSSVWTQKALEVNTFISLHLVVFVLALVLMSRTILPSRRSKKQQQRERFLTKEDLNISNNN